MHEPERRVDILARTVVDAALAVHRALGPGYVDAFYEEALCVELEARGVAFRRQEGIQLRYRGRLIGTHRLDLVVGELLVVELKAIECMTQLHFAQVLGYVRSSGLELGLLINFNVPLLKDGVRRVVATR